MNKKESKNNKKLKHAKIIHAKAKKYISICRLCVYNLKWVEWF